MACGPALAHTEYDGLSEADGVHDGLDPVELVVVGPMVFHVELFWAMPGPVAEHLIRHAQIAALGV